MKDQLQAGLQLSQGKYTLKQLLGKGGMATVWSATRRQENNRVDEIVLKIMLPQTQRSPEKKAMFLEEAQLASQFYHPFIVRAYAIESSGPFDFLVMERIWGVDLDDVLKKAQKVGRTIPWPLVARIASMIAQALHYANTQTDTQGRSLQLVHRDLKPSNLLLNAEGQIKIIDFGIAKVSFSQVKTKTGMVKGTVSYMSPEQIRAEKLDIRSDLFSLGILLYELLAGTRPFQGQSFSTLIMAIVTEEPKELRELLPEIPLELSVLLHRLLEKDREKRPKNALAFCHKLEQMLEPYQEESSQHTLQAYFSEIFPDIAQDWADYRKNLRAQWQSKQSHLKPTPPEQEIKKQAPVKREAKTLLSESDLPLALEEAATEAHSFSDLELQALVSSLPSDSQKNSLDDKKQTKTFAPEADQANTYILASGDHLPATPPLIQEQGSPPKEFSESQTFPIQQSSGAAKNLLYWWAFVMFILLVSAGGYYFWKKNQKPTHSRTISAGQDQKTTKARALSSKSPTSESQRADSGEKPERKGSESEPSPEKRRIAPKAKPEKGSVYFSISPRCKLSLKGQVLGWSSSAILKRKPGRYALRCVNTSLKLKKSFTVWIKAGRQRRLRRIYRKGSLQAFSNPWGKIIIKGFGYVGNTQKKISLYEGTYSLTFYQGNNISISQKRRITIKAGKLTRIKIKW